MTKDEAIKVKTLETAVMAHRFLYYCLNINIITDEAYTRLEKRAQEVCSKKSPVHAIGSCNQEDYTTQQILVALVMRESFTR